MSEVDLETADRGDNLPVEEPAEEPVVEAAEEEVAEAQAEAEPESEVEAAGEEAGEPERDAKGRFIPKDRFDEAVRKERAEKEQLANRLQELEQREQQRAVAADMQEASKQIKEMIKEHTSLLADGDLDKASDLMEKLLQMQSDMAERRAEAAANNAKDRAKQEVQYDALVARLETEYPAINPESPDFDDNSVRKVQAYMTGLMQTERVSPSKALQEAVDTILGAAKPPPPPAEAATDAGLRRKEAAVTKALDARQRQPASTKDVGVDSDKVGGPLDASAVMKMSYDEFEKLPDTKLAEMRGDYIN